LRQALSQIRQECTGDTMLRADKDMLHLDRNGVASDIERIEASDDPAWLAAALERCGSQALDGIELDGTFRDWLEIHRVALQDRLSRHVEALLEAAPVSAKPEIARLADIWRRVQPRSATAAAATAAPPVAFSPSAPQWVAPPPQPAIHEAAPPLLIVTPIRVTGVAAEGPPFGNLTAELLLRLSRFSELRVVAADLSGAPSGSKAFALASSSA
jgi:hypothetical protein